MKGEDEDFEYAGTPRGLFCQPRNLLSPRFQRMIADLLALQPRAAPRCSRREETGEVDSLAGLPRAAALLRGLHRAADRPPGLRRVVGRPAPDRLLPGALPRRVLRQPRDARLPRPPALVDRRRRLGALRRGAHARRSASASGWTRRCARSRAPRTTSRSPPRGRGGRDTERFDQVVIATHSDQALALLARPLRARARGARRDPLPAQRGRPAHRLHPAPPPPRRARRLELPPAARAQAAEHRHLLHEPPAAPARRPRLLRHANRTEAIDPAKIIRTIAYSHPVFTPAGVAAQAQHGAIGGFETRTHYCGAYWGWGFHEDGVLSALRACEPFGVTL